MTNLLLKLSGLGWLWDAVDGYKTYVAAALGILSGLAGVGQELLTPLSAHDAGAALAVLRHLPQDPAWLALVGGLATLGVGHKLDKATTP